MKFTSKHKTKNRRANVNRKLTISSSYCWKILGSLAEDLKGYLSTDDIYLIKKIIRERDIVAYLDLEQFWGLQCMTPESCIYTFQKYKARYTVASLLKKYRFFEDCEELDLIAKEKFIAAEKHCKFYNNFGIKDLLNGKDEFTIELLTYARSFLLKLLGETVPVKDVIENAKHGPGANLDTSGDTSVFDKDIAFPYSCTKDCIGYAAFMIKTDARWFRALVTHYRVAKSLPIDSICNVSDVLDWAICPTESNRICFVPKNAKTSRSIAIEPALNVMLQLGVDHVIRAKLKRWGVDLNSQTHNRQLARVGSIGNAYATLDLKAASDTVSLSICEALLPTEWNQFLLKLRSPSGSLSGHNIVYNKMSSMGNGFTFVLESALFAAVIYAVYKINNVKVDFQSNAAVFGDDLIVISDLTSQVVRGLNLCGFELNLNKSFVTGPCRESCGADWFKGRPLRPILLTKRPEDIHDLYVDFNTITRMLELRFGIVESNSAATILRWIPTDLRFWGPPSNEVFDSWLFSKDMPLIQSNGLYRFNRILRYPRRRFWTKAYIYGYWHFLVHNHSLKPSEEVPFYSKFKSYKTGGNRFDLRSKIHFKSRQISTVSHIWDIDYQDSDLSGSCGG